MLPSLAFGNTSVTKINYKQEQVFNGHVFFLKNKIWVGKKPSCRLTLCLCSKKKKRLFSFGSRLAELWGCTWTQQRRRILAVRRSRVRIIGVGLPCSRALCLRSSCSVRRCRWFFWAETFWLLQMAGRWWWVPSSSSNISTSSSLRFCCFGELSSAGCEFLEAL